MTFASVCYRKEQRGHKNMHTSPPLKNRNYRNNIIVPLSETNVTDQAKVGANRVEWSSESLGRGLSRG